MSKAQSGNILFLILIAVALFAALSYAVTSSTRGGSTNVSPDKYRLIASQIQQYGATLSSAITRMRVSGGCQDTDIDFYLSGITNTAYQHSPDAPVKCKIFHPQGGSISYTNAGKIFGTVLSYDLFVARASLPGHGLTCSTAECSDLYWIIELPAQIEREKFCRIYNEIAGHAGPIVQAAIYGSPGFNGNYIAEGSTGAANLPTGASTVCHAYQNDPTRFMIIYVILAR